MSEPRWGRLLINATLATFADARPFGLQERAAIAVHHGSVAWLGSMDALTAAPATLAAAVESVDGALLTPWLVDCHTHLVFAGNRAQEFDQRLNRASYEAIARVPPPKTSCMRNPCPARRHCWPMASPRLKSNPATA